MFVSSTPQAVATFVLERALVGAVMRRRLAKLCRGQGGHGPRGVCPIASPGQCLRLSCVCALTFECMAHSRQDAPCGKRARLSGWVPRVRRRPQARCPLLALMDVVVASAPRADIPPSTRRWRVTGRIASPLSAHGFLRFVFALSSGTSTWSRPRPLARTMPGCAFRSMSWLLQRLGRARARTHAAMNLRHSSAPW